tara:strand:+ start:4365 stop:5375 length:1011 start_codon:yes stop_codon:yes gene_type:complete
MVRSQEERRASLLSAINKKIKANHTGRGGQNKRSVYEIEAETIQWLSNELKCQGVEIRYWQDGTKSDFGVRKLGSLQDRWLPIQLKSTLKDKYPFVAYSVANYKCDVLFCAVRRKDLGVWVFSPNFIESNQEQLHGHRDLYISTSHTVWPTCRVKMDSLGPLLIEKLESSTLFSEFELCMQATKDSQTEYKAMKLFMQMNPTLKFGIPPVRNTVVDLLADGRRLQFKSANSNLLAGISKKFAGMSVPYASGDCDAYIVYKFVSNAIVFWEFPEDVLIQRGVLSTYTQDGRYIGSIGRQSMHVQMNDVDMKRFKFALPKRSNANRWTSVYSSVYEFK